MLEHIDDDMGAIRELVRVLRPGGTIAATVPSFLPERICWALTDEYHAPYVPGGHVRIYTQAELRNKLGTAGAEPYARHKEHGIHAPTGGSSARSAPPTTTIAWCAPTTRRLCWDIGGTRPWSRPAPTAPSRR